MKSRMVLPLFVLQGIAGCVMHEKAYESTTNASTPLFNCMSTKAPANVKYLGEYKGAENNITTRDMVRDIACSEKFKSELSLTDGYVTVMGGSKFGRPEDKFECNTKTANSMSCDEQEKLKVENNKLYKNVQTFSQVWTQSYGDKYPIMTGAGPGLMEAGSRGAKEFIDKSTDSKKRYSIGYTTYYTPFDSNNPLCGSGPRCADPALILQKFNGNIITDGVIFTSVTVRESQMIRHSSAILIGPGGTGTEWEIYQLIETIKSAQLNPIPIFLIGNKERYWTTLINRIGEMEKRGAVSRGDIKYDNPRCNGFTKSEAPNLKDCGKVNFEFIENPNDAIEKLRNRLNL